MEYQKLPKEIESLKSSIGNLNAIIAHIDMCKENVPIRVFDVFSTSVNAKELVAILQWEIDRRNKKLERYEAVHEELNSILSGLLNK